MSMKRKWLAVGIILLFVGTCIIPSTAKPISITANTEPQSGNFFGLNGNIDISWDMNETEEPIIPRGELRVVHLTVMFWTTWGILGRVISYLYRGQPIALTLSIIDKPEWCSAVIHQEDLLVPLPEKENTYEIAMDAMSIQLYDTAPAFELFPITIQTTMQQLRDPFGLFPVMQGTTKTVNITFKAAYKPLLSLHFPAGKTIETPPLVPVVLPIGIANLGNGKTIVQNEIVYLAKDFTVTMPSQVILDVDEYKEINVTITAPYNFFYSEKTMTVGFTPHYSDNYALQGEIIYETFLVYYY
jgi:hypothetical protein